MLTSRRPMSPTHSSASAPASSKNKSSSRAQPAVGQLTQTPAPRKGGPRTSIDTIRSTRKHQEYLDSLVPPSPDALVRISTVQQQKEEEGSRKRTSEENAQRKEEESRAAGLIQRNYRGHRERRVLDGMTLDPSTRWIEAVKEARYRNLTMPRARAEVEEKAKGSFDGGGRVSSSGEVSEGSTTGPEGGTPKNSVTLARQNWKKIATIARRAGGDEDSGSDEEEEGSERDGDAAEAEKAKERRTKRLEQRMIRQNAAKIMDLQYFLEMVDLKHRYGSNLRTYHTEWRKADTKENFFYWLDYGEGRFIDCQGCPRERLDREQVRYLSKEERLNYLVKVDKEGRLCWAKNGARIDTTTKFKDSIQGIVPDTDDTPAYAPATAEAATGLQDDEDTSCSSDDSDGEPDEEESRANKYATPELDGARGMTKVKHLSTATIFNKLLRGSVKKNTWIFVADTHFRLYVGIKQSGAFQHSSFLHGSRISAAGLVKIKNGLLTKLSPLSGHYRPPAANFKAFVPSLKEAGVDMSHVTISRSYAVLLGLEAYVRSRRRGEKIVRKIMHHRNNILSPELELEEMEKREAREREERLKELKEKATADDEQDDKGHRLRKKLHIRSKHDSGDQAHVDESRQRRSGSGSRPLEEDRRIEDVDAPRNGPEDAVAPEGMRKSQS